MVPIIGATASSCSKRDLVDVYVDNCASIYNDTFVKGIVSKNFNIIWN